MNPTVHIPTEVSVHGIAPSAWLEEAVRACLRSVLQTRAPRAVRVRFPAHAQAVEP